MKSLIEEASSIAKAIEKGWERAGKPHSFSVKIFELPEKNFFGLTTKAAKIGIFFTEDKQSGAHKKDQTATIPSPQQHKQMQESSLRTKTKTAPTTKQTTEKSYDVEGKTQRVAKPRVRPAQEKPIIKPVHGDQQKEGQTVITLHDETAVGQVWSAEMVHIVQAWIREILNIIGLPNVEFSTDIQKNNLKINFEMPLVDNEMKESILYKNLAYLVMASLRAQFKADCKQLKLALIRE